MLLLDTLAMTPTKRRPVWIMRQAGRYLEKFREYRKKYSFEELCHQPDLALQISMLPMKKYSLDAAIVFSDILFPLRALGAKLSFTEEGPLLENPKNPEELSKLKTEFDPEKETAAILETLKLLRKEVPKEKAVLGFAGAPFTLLAYLLEGKLTKELKVMKRWLAEHPKLVHECLQKLSKSIGLYLDAQAHAGADAVQLFDTWASALSPEDFETFALPYARQVLSAVTVPSIYYVNGVGGILSSLNSVGAQAISVDWRVDLKDVRRLLSPVTAVQGNLDPASLLLSPSVLRERVFKMLDSYGTGAGHIVNLGHGITPDIPEDRVEVFISATAEWSAAHLK